MVVLTEALHEEKNQFITIISSYSSKDTALSFPIEEMVQYSQPATRSLAGHPRGWCNVWDSVLVSDAGRSGTQQQR